MRGRLSMGRDCGWRGESRDVLRVVASGQVAGLWACRGRLGWLGEGWQAQSVRGESCDSSSSPEPSAGLIGVGQPLRGCEGFGVVTPGIALRPRGSYEGCQAAGSASDSGGEGRRSPCGVFRFPRGALTRSCFLYFLTMPKQRLRPGAFFARGVFASFFRCASGRGMVSLSARQPCTFRASSSYEGCQAAGSASDSGGEGRRSPCGVFRFPRGALTRSCFLYFLTMPKQRLRPGAFFARGVFASFFRCASGRGMVSLSARQPCTFRASSSYPYADSQSGYIMGYPIPIQAGASGSI